jgi:pSer/pThr/pTyr-binding forkhead associated (FHA) protein
VPSRWPPTASSSGGDGSTGKLDDGRVSRRHARVAFEAGRWMVTDLGSQNGTDVDGTPIAAHLPTPA